MWISPEQFQLVQELREAGLEPRFEAGDIVIRGFADLGYEEFQILPGGNILSLTAGTVSALDTDQRGHFAWLPSIDEVIGLLEKRSFVISKLVRQEAREWSLSLSTPNDMEIHVAHGNMHTAMLLGLKNALTEQV